jgi:hypothetical protein
MNTIIEHNRKSIPWWDQVKDDELNTLFLTELTIHASTQSIRNIFEDILTHYIGPPLMSLSQRKLVLDVRYVHSKQCAFMDMETPEVGGLYVGFAFAKAKTF